MSEHPAVRGKGLAVRLRPLAVIVGVSLDPTLKVVAVGGGKDFARGGVISKMCHDFFLSFSREVLSLSVIILYHTLTDLSRGF